MNRGFTLMEMLIVVLIIAVLTAITFPQYQYLIYKSRYTQLVTLCDTIVNAQVRHRLATGTYTNRFDDLDVSLPSGGRVTTSEYQDSTSYPKFNITILGSTDPVNNPGLHNVAIGYMSAGGLNYYHYYPRLNGEQGERQCRCNNESACKICEKLGAVYTREVGSEGSYYLFK